jgi:hypothetical protein
MKSIFDPKRAAALLLTATVLAAAPAGVFAESTGPTPTSPPSMENTPPPTAGAGDRITAAIAMGELRKLGFQPEMSVDNAGVPRIALNVDGYRWAVFFYGCAAAAAPEARQCTSMQFLSGYNQQNPVPLATINRWNTEKRFARAYTYVTSDGKPGARIEVDVFFASPGGDPAVSFRAYYNIMKVQAAAFRKHIGFQ